MTDNKALTEYKGVPVRQLNGIYSRLINGSYTNGTLYISKRLQGQRLDTVLQHEYYHYEFSQKHKFMHLLVMPDWLFLPFLYVSFAALILSPLTFVALIVALSPTLVNEIVTHRRTAERQMVFFYSFWLTLGLTVTAAVL